MRKIRLTPGLLPNTVKEAKEKIPKGKIVAYPTDTVYDIATDINNEAAASRLIFIKGVNVPTPLATDSLESDQRIGVFNSSAKRPAELLWPGPVTLIVKGQGKFDEPFERYGKIALRVPDHIFPRVLAKELYSILISTSASLHGLFAPIFSYEVERMLDEKIDMLIDDGPTKYISMSTFIDTTMSPPKIVRPGVLSPEDIELLTGIRLTF